MLTEQLLAQLQTLNEARLDRSDVTRVLRRANTGGRATSATLGSDAQIFGTSQGQVAAFPDEATTVTALEELIPGQVEESAGGMCYRIRQPVAELTDLRRVGLGRSNTGGQATSATQPLHGEPKTTRPHELALAEERAFLRAFPGEALFVDLETCGFSGSIVFLIGMVHVEEGELILDQLLARDYAEERAIMEQFWQVAQTKQVLVSFNGKSFDWPMLRDRTAYHRLPYDGIDLRQPSRRKRRGKARWEFAHYDLLHHCRRRWKHALPNCRLKTLERYVCGRHRSGDIPGSEIPAAYHEYVRSHDARTLRSVLHHNALDLVTLAELAVTIQERTRVAS